MDIETISTRFVADASSYFSTMDEMVARMTRTVARLSTAASGDPFQGLTASAQIAMRSATLAMHNLRMEQERAVKMLSIARATQWDEFSLRQETARRNFIDMQARNAAQFGRWARAAVRRGAMHSNNLPVAMNKMWDRQKEALAKKEVAWAEESRRFSAEQHERAQSLLARNLSASTALRERHLKRIVDLQMRGEEIAGGGRGGGGRGGGGRGGGHGGRGSGEGSFFHHALGRSTDHWHTAFMGGVAGGAAYYSIILATRAMYRLGMSFVDAGRYAIKAAADYEMAAISLEVMSGSAEKAGQLLTDINKLAVETPFRTPELLDGAKQLKAFGFETDQLVPILNSLGEAASGTGTPLNRIILAFGQIRVAGRLMGPELRQLVDAGIPVFEELSKVMGKPVSAIKHLVEEGQVSFPILQQAFNKMTGPGGLFGGLMERQSITVAGRWSAFVETLEYTARDIGRSFFQGFDIANLLDDMREWAQAFRKDTSDVTGFFVEIRQGIESIGAFIKMIWQWGNANATLVNTFLKVTGVVMGLAFGLVVLKAIAVLTIIPLMGLGRAMLNFLPLIGIAAAAFLLFDDPIGIIGKLHDALFNMGKGTISFTQMMKQVAGTVIVLITLFYAWRAAILAFHAAMILVNAVLTVYRMILITLRGIITAVTALQVAWAAAAVGTTVIGFILSGILSAISLVSVAAIALTAAFVGLLIAITQIDSTDLSGFFGRMGGLADNLGKTFSQVFQGVKDAINGDDFKLAGEIAFTGLEVAFKTIVAAIKEEWIRLKEFLKSPDMYYEIRRSAKYELLRSEWGLARTLSPWENNPEQDKKWVNKLNAYQKETETELAKMALAREDTITPQLAQLQTPVIEAQERLDELVNKAHDLALFKEMTADAKKLTLEMREQLRVFESFSKEASTSSAIGGDEIRRRMVSLREAMFWVEGKKPNGFDLIPHLSNLIDDTITPKDVIKTLSDFGIIDDARKGFYSGPGLRQKSEIYGSLEQNLRRYNAVLSQHQNAHAGVAAINFLELMNNLNINPMLLGSEKQEPGFWEKTGAMIAGVKKLSPGEGFGTPRIDLAIRGKAGDFAADIRREMEKELDKGIGDAAGVFDNFMKKMDYAHEARFGPLNYKDPELAEGSKHYLGASAIAGVPFTVGHIVGGPKLSGLAGGLGGAITDEQYRFAFVHQFDDLARWANKQEENFPKAMLKGSAEAQDTINRTNYQSITLEEEMRASMIRAEIMQKEWRDLQLQKFDILARLLSERGFTMESAATTAASVIKAIIPVIGMKEGG